MKQTADSPSPESHAAFPWFAVWVKGRSEQDCAAHLRARGYAPFVPVYFERRRWSDRFRVLELPLFPGYLFCRFDPRDRLPILTAPGVIQVLGAGKNLLPIDEREMESIRAISRSELPKRPWPYLKVGQRVQIASGPLCGVSGLLTETRGESRLVVSVELLRRAVAVEVDLRSTEIIPLTGSPRLGSLALAMGH